MIAVNRSNTAYKLGELKAAEDFASWVRDLDHDNPTQAPPKMASVSDIAVAHVLEKLGAPRKKKIQGKKLPVNSGASRKPMHNGSRFKTLKKALKKKRRKR